MKNEILRIDTKTNDAIVLDVPLGRYCIWGTVYGYGILGKIPDFPMECTSATTLGESHIIVAGGWDGHNSLDTVHLFKVIEEKPFLVRVKTDVKLTEKRNRPVLVGVEL